ncbi:hypothetical protein F4821DRAFT_27351 [Hypoxylon rubiginosum]|uniref:Uncharacterized protein n=1 Tax=Hypoxylon rubiginosum TaxID=110542 RepID=A0ACC0CM50_9PEZI|nr:hypothetical protein F4821DRAFT_27351 [Hypoxylon rubiginosum]
MPVNMPDTTSPLRQSCDRCRELKVRCKPSPTISILQTGANGLPLCVRCARAGADCTYSPQQRTGRPHLPRQRPRQPSTPARQNQTSLGITTLGRSEPVIDFSPDVPNETLLQTLFSLEANGFGQSASEEVTHLNELSPGGSPDMFPELMRNDNQPQLQQYSGGFSAVLPDPPISALESAPDPLEKDTLDLAALNIRIYKMTRAMSDQDGIIASAKKPPTDEMIDIIRCVLQVLDRIVARTADGRDAQLRLSPDSLQSELEHNLNMHAIDPPKYLSSTTTLGSALDTGIVFMVLACHQRILDMFKNICLSLHRHICSSTGTSSGQGYSTETRSNRGLYQLALAMGALNDTADPLGPSTSLQNSLAETCEGSHTITPSRQSTEKFEGSHTISQASDQEENNSCLYAAKSVTGIVQQKQAALNMHLQLLKRSIRQSDGI